MIIIYIFLKNKNIFDIYIYIYYIRSLILYMHILYIWYIYIFDTYIYIWYIYIMYMHTYFKYTWYMIFDNMCVYVLYIIYIYIYIYIWMTITIGWPSLGEWSFSHRVTSRTVASLSVPADEHGVTSNRGWNSNWRVWRVILGEGKLLALYHVIPLNISECKTFLECIMHIVYHVVLARDGGVCPIVAGYLLNS